jgi:glycosyltransferase involved in cell wall biosynthesis
VGRLCAEKGQWVLIDAMRELARRGRQARLTLVGDGPGRQMIERRVREQNLDEMVDLVGWQGSDRVRELLAKSTALVIGSFAEGLPVVAMEALAASRPVIATNIAAMSELIEPGVNGWLVAPGSPELLADAMESALDAPNELLSRMGAAGRTAVLERHHPRRQAEQLQALLASVAGGAQTRTAESSRAARACIKTESPALTRGRSDPPTVAKAGQR